MINELTRFISAQSQPSVKVIEFPKIILDIDNVLADSMEIFCQKASKLVGFEIEKQHVRNHKVVGSIPLTPQTILASYLASY